MRRTNSELQDLGVAVAKMFGAYPSMFVSESATDALLEYLDDFEASVAVQAMRLTPMFVPNRYPNATEVREVAGHIVRCGYRACLHAARNWRSYCSVEKAALVGQALREEVDRAFAKVGNPDLPPPAALIPDEATPCDRPLTDQGREFKEGYQRRLAEIEQRGEVTGFAAFCRAVGQQVAATQTKSESVPGRKRRGFA